MCAYLQDTKLNYSLMKILLLGDMFGCTKCAYLQDILKYSLTHVLAHLLKSIRACHVISGKNSAIQKPVKVQCNRKSIASAFFAMVGRVL